MNTIQKDILEQVAGIREIPAGAYNIRLDGGSIGAQSTEQVQIEPKPDGTGIHIRVKPKTIGERIHIPVVISKSGIVETVYNDFYIGENADVTIVAGCGIHNCGEGRTQHDGVHTFYIGQGARVKYIEKHYGAGDGTGTRVLNPVTNIYLEKEAVLEMDTVQIRGVDSTKRRTFAELKKRATLIVKEKLMTHGGQFAETEFEVHLNGEGSSTNLVSRSVARGDSRQSFLSKIYGNNACMGHSECDAIIMDHACVKAIPEIVANHVDAALIHEAAIGKIAGEQILKLMTLGLTNREAEAQIVEGFLR